MASTCRLCIVFDDSGVDSIPIPATMPVSKLHDRVVLEHPKVSSDTAYSISI